MNFCGAFPCAPCASSSLGPTPPPTDRPTGSPTPSPTQYVAPVVLTPTGRGQNVDNFDRFMAELRLPIQGCSGAPNDAVLCASCAIAVCSNNGFIIGLSLIGITQQFSIPQSIGGFVNLQTVTITGNSGLVSTIPSSIGNLNTLFVLVISSNPRLGGSIPTEIAAIFQLFTLVIRDNPGLVGTIPSQIADMPYLFQINIWKNPSISGTVPSQLASKLQFDPSLAVTVSIDLSECNLTGTVPPFSLAPLTFLNLVGNKLTGTIPDFPKSLTKLYLGYNSLKSTIPASFSQHLWTSLSFPRNFIYGTIPRLFINYELTAFSNNLTGTVPLIAGGVVKISLDNNSLVAFHPDYHRATLTSLRDLSFESNRFTTINDSVAAFMETMGYPNLTYLSARRNQIAGSFPIEYGVSSLNLKYINLAENYITGHFSFVLSCTSGCKLDSTDVVNIVKDLSVIGRSTVTYIFDQNRLNLSASPYGAVAIRYESAKQLEGVGGLGEFLELLPNVESWFYFGLGLQEVNECTDPLHPHACQYQCVEGWFPLFDYTCGCPEGYFLNGDRRTCSAISNALSAGQVAAIMVGLVVFLALLGAALTIGFMYYSYATSEIHLLPEEISWSLKHYLTRWWEWTHCGSKASSYYTRQYQPDSPEFHRVDLMREAYFDGKGIYPKHIYAIYNPVVTSAFIKQWNITYSRRKNDSSMFRQDLFEKAKDKQRKFVIDHFLEDNCYNYSVPDVHDRKFPWNTREARCEVAPLIPAVHGTDFLIAEKIAQTGFVSLSSLDAGYFAKGIYFTQVLHYTLTYAVSHRTPAVIVSFLNMGNVYAVTEDHKGPKSLMGCALKPAYQSHFVLTTQDGNVYNQESDPERRLKICNEMVVGQESQILPLFIITLDLENVRKQYEGWTREIPTLTDKIQFKEIKPVDQAGLAALLDGELADGEIALADQTATASETWQSMDAESHSMVDLHGDRYYRI